ncbi:hypothetical protein [Pontibacter akesuensis]|uniref:hypothetical protein n=1 Tax=Pontibacter akesuensis TaxID=388950 RepID=UPI00111436F2|nr:hypothetical protein [Pontibacter akesuensis]
MKSNVHPSAKVLVESCLSIIGLHPKGVQKAATVEEEPAGFATIDGSMVSHHSGSYAISSGSGIFIGDYFVGFADSCQSITLPPYSR